MVIEDDPEIRDLEIFLLRAEGYAVAGVGDGFSATAAVKDEHAEVVLLDLMLPGKDGNEILGELGRDPATAQIPVIVVSAFARQLRPSPQVKRVLRKPFEVADLLDAVAQVANGDEAR